MVAGYRDGTILAISPSLLVVLLLPSESPSLDAAPWLGATQYIYICTAFTCLHTGDSTTPLLLAQRVSPVRFVGTNKHDNVQSGTVSGIFRPDRK